MRITFISKDSGTTERKTRWVPAQCAIQNTFGPMVSAFTHRPSSYLPFNRNTSLKTFLIIIRIRQIGARTVKFRSVSDSGAFKSPSHYFVTIQRQHLHELEGEQWLTEVHFMLSPQYLFRLLYYSINNRWAIVRPSVQHGEFVLFVLRARFDPHRWGRRLVVPDDP